MTLPDDIARIRHSWQRRDQNAWTSAAFRSLVIVWLDTFLTAHMWARSISVVEKFHAPGVHRRKPFGPLHRVEDPRTIEEGFRQSDAKPLLVFTAVRDSDSEEMEVAIEFPGGAFSATLEIDFRLSTAKTALEAEEARRPLA